MEKKVKEKELALRRKRNESDSQNFDYVLPSTISYLQRHYRPRKGEAFESQGSPREGRYFSQDKYVASMHERRRELNKSELRSKLADGADLLGTGDMRTGGISVMDNRPYGVAGG